MRLTVSTARCMAWKWGIIRQMTRPTETPRSGTATATSQASPTSSRTAMMMPPTIMIGAVTIIASIM